MASSSFQLQLYHKTNHLISMFFERALLSMHVVIQLVPFSSLLIYMQLIIEEIKRITTCLSAFLFSLPCFCFLFLFILLCDSLSFFFFPFLLGIKSENHSHCPVMLCPLFNLVSINSAIYIFLCLLIQYCFGK